MRWNRRRAGDFLVRYLISFAAFLVMGICQAQELRIGSALDFAPYAYKAGDESKGFEVDLARALCVRLQKACSITDVPFDSLIPRLQAGQIDLIISSLSPTPDRRASVAFSQPYAVVEGKPVAIGARKADRQLLKDVDTALQSVVASGIYKQLEAQYFPNGPSPSSGLSFKPAAAEPAKTDTRVHDRQARAYAQPDAGAVASPVCARVRRIQRFDNSGNGFIEEEPIHRWYMFRHPAGSTLDVSGAIISVDTLPAPPSDRPDIRHFNIPRYSVPTPLQESDLDRLTVQDWSIVKQIYTRAKQDQLDRWRSASNTDGNPAWENMRRHQMRAIEMTVATDTALIDCYLAAAGQREPAQDTVFGDKRQAQRLALLKKAYPESHGLPPGSELDRLSATYQYAFEVVTEAERRNAQKKGNGPRSKEIVPRLENCLRAVDIRADSTVRGMYWYSIENICAQPVRAFWCEGPGCKKVNLAADIEANGKRQSWMPRAKSASGVKFHGLACPLQSNGRTVYFDNARNQCYVNPGQPPLPSNK